MDRISLAFRHLPASIAGFARLFLKSPGFALVLGLKRFCYFAFRRFRPGLLTPEGYEIQTRDALIAYWSMFVEREVWHPLWVEAIRRASQPVVLDIGANAGVFSCLVFSINPKAKVVAFEPLPMMAEQLRALRNRCGWDLTCIQKAAGDAPGTVRFETTAGVDGTSRIAGNELSEGAHTLEVETTTVDREIGDSVVTLAKIDVEGAESAVLAGAQKMLSRTTFLIIEAHTDADLRSMLDALGPNWTPFRMGSSDFLFVRNA